MRQILLGSEDAGIPRGLEKKKLNCWEVFACGEHACPAYQRTDNRCWLISNTHCRNQIQGKFIEKMEMCLDCEIFTMNIDVSAMQETIRTASKQFKRFRQYVDEKDAETEKTSKELAVGLAETFEALKKISTGDPTVRIPESSNIELISRLKQIVNMTAENIAEFVNQSHEFAICLAEHFDVLNRVSKGDLSAQVSGESNNELLEALKKVTNNMIRNVSEYITQRDHAMEELRTSESRLRAITDAARDAIILMDHHGAVSFWNPAAETIFGYRKEEAIGKNLHELLSPERYLEAHRAAYPEFLRTGRGNAVGKRIEIEARRKDGQEITVALSLSALSYRGAWHAVGILRDITEQKRAEQNLKMAEIELRQAQKLQAVGQLAAGIAHEINTPVQFIGDSLYFLSDAFRIMQNFLIKYRQALSSLAHMPGYESVINELKEAEEVADIAYIEENAPAAFERAVDGVSRISTIVKAMKEFAHPDQKEKSLADLNRALLTSLTIAKNEYKYVADVETDLGDLPMVTCHIGDINQVFLNLLVNAAHAIADAHSKDGKKGVIHIRTRHDGSIVRIEISDNGCGIPEDIQYRVFDPFFTTKEVGRGSGQGLSIARSIVVDKHGGSLTFQSEVGKGTIFVICLPVDGKPMPNVNETEKKNSTPHFPPASTSQAQFL